MELDTPKVTEFGDEYDAVYDCWINSFKKSPWAGCVPNHKWFEVQRETINGLLDRGARVLCAVTPIAGREDEYPHVRRVMGYVVFEPGVLHWLYVKQDYRGHGIGHALLDAVTDNWDGPTATRFYTHRTRASVGFLGDGWTHKPELARVKALSVR